MTKEVKSRKEKLAGKNIDDVVRWYTIYRSTYETLAEKVAEIIGEVMDNRGIEYYTVSYRAKDIDAFREKAMKEKYSNPIKEIKDLAGIRVITYVESEANKVVGVVKNLFEVDFEHSVDKSKALGIDRVGYRSIHYVAKFSSQRCKLPEFKRFSGFEFEIQIRTILQHAWAEIEHDKNYKYTGILPKEMQRRFSILAGVLELADSEFDQISQSLDLYKNEVAEKTKKGNLEIKINTTALREFLNNRFEQAINAGLKPIFGPDDDDAKEIINELNDFGIKTLSELDKIIPEDLEKKYIELDAVKEGNFLGFVRSIMMLEDVNHYFEKAWKSKWGVFSNASREMLELYEIDLEEFGKKYHIKL